MPLYTTYTTETLVKWMDGWMHAGKIYRVAEVADLLKAWMEESKKHQESKKQEKRRQEERNDARMNSRKQKKDMRKNESGTMKKETVGSWFVSETFKVSDYSVRVYLHLHQARKLLVQSVLVSI